MKTKGKRADQIHIRLPADLKEWLRREAAKDDRTMNYLIIRILQDWRAGAPHDLLRKGQEQ